MTIGIATLAIGCKTASVGGISIPPLAVERPERPYLEGSYEDMVKDLILYCGMLDGYCDRLEQYIAEVDRILNDNQD